jgi:hypothetical protein
MRKVPLPQFGHSPPVMATDKEATDGLSKNLGHRSNRLTF